MARLEPIKKPRSCYIGFMADLTLPLPHELSKKLEDAATKEAKEPERFVLDMLERLLEPSLDFIGAWVDSPITPEDVVAVRTTGRDIRI